MPRIFAILFSMLFATVAHAQGNGYTAVKNLATLQAQFKANHAATQTIQSTFVQVKAMKMLSEDLKSKGVFYYKKPDKMRIQYQAPFNYLVVYRAGQMMVKDDKKSSKINTKNSAMMKSLNNVMVACMTGDLFSNKDFKVSALENKSGYLIKMLPTDAAMKKLFQQFEVFVEKETMAVSKLIISEQGGDVTQMSFAGTRKNATVDERLFQLK